MNAIGGYFELELRNGNKDVFNSFSYSLNSCRNALILLVKNKGYKKVYIPYYTCEVVTDVLVENNILIEYYKIDEKLEIDKSFVFSSLDNKDAFLYTNYFGLKDDYIKSISQNIPNLIIDNAQAFFSKPIKGVDTVYSPRKFFGLPDGGFLNTKMELELDNYPQDISIDRCSHLLKRLELSPEEGYQDFQENDSKLVGMPVKKMSKLTSQLLSHIDYEKVKQRRRENYNFLHAKLRDRNELKLKYNEEASPMAYPLLLADGQILKKRLIENKVFVATYWPEVLQKVSDDSFETYLVNNLIALPIDQRYGLKEMKFILNLL